MNKFYSNMTKTKQGGKPEAFHIMDVIKCSLILA